MDNTNMTNSAGFPNSYIQVMPGTVTVSPVGFPPQTVQGTPPADVTEMGGKTVTVPPATVGESGREPATIDFGFKSDPQEVEIDGQLGLLCSGFASKYNETDAVGEEQLPGAFRSFGEEWFAQREPLVLFQHGMDAALGARPIGRGLDYKMLPDGVYVEVFVPKDADEGWYDKRAKKRFAEVYNGIKTGAIRGFSVGGAFTRFGKKLANWATVELSITPIPCLASATFALGSKAVIDRYGAVPMGLADEPQEQNTLGVLTRSHWNAAMGLARQDKAHSLHDHLLGYEPALQGKHDSEDCAICSDRREMMGVKAASRDAYLVAEGDNPSDWHLPVKKGSGYDRGLCGAAWAALHKGYRGNKYEGPNKGEAIAKLKRIYKSQGWDLPDDSGSGGKSEDLDAHAMVAEATAFLAEFNNGVKAGARHSRQTKEAVRLVVQHLTDTFGLHDNKDEGGSNG
jgi:phage head maturation protease